MEKAYYIRASHPEDNETVKTPGIKSTNAILVPGSQVSIAYSHEGNRRGTIIQDLSGPAWRIFREIVNNPYKNPRGLDSKVDVTEFDITPEGIDIITKGPRTYEVKLKKEFDGTLESLTGILSGDNITLLSKLRKRFR